MRGLTRLLPNLGQHARRGLASLLLSASAWLLATGCGGTEPTIRARTIPSVGNLRLAAQPIFGGPTGQVEDIQKIWVRVRAMGGGAVDRDFDLHRLSEAGSWEADIDQKIRAGEYEFTAFVFADEDADPEEDEPLFVSSRVPVTIHDERETSVLIILGPRPALPQSEVPYIESVVIEPSNADPRDEVVFRVRAGGGDGRLSVSGWSPAWAEAGYSGWFAQGAYVDATGTAELRGVTAPVPGFWAVALRVQDLAGNAADVGVTLSNGKRNPFFPMTWNLSPVVTLAGTAHSGGEGVGVRIDAGIFDDRSATLTYRWTSPCEMTFVEEEGAPAEGVFKQSERGKSGRMHFFLLLEEGSGACPLTLRVTDEEGASAEALLNVNTERLDVEVLGDDWSEG